MNLAGPFLTINFEFDQDHGPSLTIYAKLYTKKHCLDKEMGKIWVKGFYQND